MDLRAYYQKIRKIEADITEPVVVIVSRGGLMASATVTVLLCAGVPASVTLKVSATALLVCVGVPLTRPLAALSASPAGRAPPESDQL